MLVYIDDIEIIGYRTYDEQLTNIEQALDILCKSGMQINPTKCIWAKDEIEYLSFILTTQEDQPQPKKD